MEPSEQADEPPAQPSPGGAGEEQDVAAVRAHEIGSRKFLVADVDPIDGDGIRTVTVGTVLWLVAFLVLLPFYARLEEQGRLWWLWTCLAGFGLGMFGWEYCRRRQRRRVRG